MTAATSAYEPVIGLEIHVQLATRTKMFCGCRLGFGEEPNTRVCPVCLGHPGTLPVANAEAVHLGLMIAMAFGSEILPASKFHRKNYFYPDLPKGYQISQYDEPLALGGSLAEVTITRVHLEEDAAKLIHIGTSGRIDGAGASLVDFNRGGTPLAEIVTEPDIGSPAQAREWAALLRQTVKRMGVSDANMEEGSLRIDANVSIRRRGDRELGTKTELKNMNSFRFLERGLMAEIDRQVAILDGGGRVEQATMHFDPASGSIVTMRSKEEAHDYRYFPEPDLVPVRPTEEMLRRARAAVPELPLEQRDRLEREYGLTRQAAATLVGSAGFAALFESAAADEARPDPRALANIVVGEVVARLRERGSPDPAETPLEPGALAKLVRMVGDGQVTGNAASEVLAELVERGGDPARIVEERGLKAIGSGSDLDEIVARAIDTNPDIVERIRAGKGQAVGALVGAVMRETRGRADGKQVGELIRRQLGIG